MRLRAIFFSLLIVIGCLVWIRLGAESPKQPAGQPLLYTSTAKYEPLAWMSAKERFPLGATLLVREESASRPLVPQFSAAADAAISFDGTRVLFAGKETANDRWQIWEVVAGGGHPRRVTSCSENCIRPFYLPGDRVVYGREVKGRYVIETAALDGTAPLQLTHVPSNALPTDVLADGRVLFAAAYPLGSGATPEIYTVYTDGSGVEAYRCDHGAARSAGKQLSSGDILFVRDGSPARFTSALAHDVALPTQGEQFAGDVAEINRVQWIESSRPDAKHRYSLLVTDATTGASTTLLADANADLAQPVALRANTVPKMHPSGLHDWTYANLLCLNAYTSKYQFATGSVGAVKLYTRAENGKPVLLGRAPVEADGSFFVQVSGDQPLQFELVDHSGKTLKREQGWWWASRGEQRVCVGCHAGPERAPENAVPTILLKSTEPVALLTPQTHASKGGR